MSRQLPQCVFCWVLIEDKTFALNSFCFPFAMVIPCLLREPIHTNSATRNVKTTFLCWTTHPFTHRNVKIIPHDFLQSSGLYQTRTRCYSCVKQNGLAKVDCRLYNRIFQKETLIEKSRFFKERRGLFHLLINSHWTNTGCQMIPKQTNLVLPLETEVVGSREFLIYLQFSTEFFGCLEVAVADVVHSRCS